MKVLHQRWRSENGELLQSISKDQAHLDATLRRAEAKGDGTEPYEPPEEVEIPDKNTFVELLERATVFLHKDEADFLGLFY